MSTIRRSEYIGDNGPHTLIFSQGHSCEADAFGARLSCKLASLAG